MENRTLWAALLAVPAGAMLLAWLAWPRPPQAAGPDDPPRPTVDVAKVERREMRVTLRAVGTVEPFNTVTVRSRVDGQILHVFYTEGQMVQRDQPLLEIDPAPYQAQDDLAEANLEKDKATLLRAQADLARTENLLARGFATRQTDDLDHAEVAQLHAAIKADEATLRMAALQLGYTTIRAPIAGRVGQRLVDEGNMVRADEGTVLVQIIQTEPVSVVFSLPQENLPAIRRAASGEPPAVEAYSTGGETLLGVGKLTFIANGIDQSTGTIGLKAEFQNAGHTLWDGQFVEARLEIASLPDALVVPSGAVQHEGNKSFLYVLDARDSRVSARNVRVLLSADGDSAVEGVAADDRVVTDGYDQLAPGILVSAVGPPAGTDSPP